MTERVAERYIEAFLHTLDKLGITHDFNPETKGYISTEQLLEYWYNQGVIQYDI